MSPWQIKPLSETLLEAKPGFACGEDPPEGVFQFRMNNITTEGQIDLSKKRRVPKNTRSLDAFLVKPGDVLFNATNSPELVGKSALFTGQDEPAVFSNHFLRLRPRADQLDGRFLARWLTLQFQHRTFQGMCRQWVNQVTVGRESFLALRIPLPPLAEQRRIAEVPDRAEALRAKRRTALAQLDSLTQSLFLDLIAGKVRHSDLKRIAPSIEAAYKRSRLRGDEILVSCVGSIGVVALADESVKGFNIARAVARIPLAETTIVLSPIELQREFARRVGAVEKLKSAQRASLAELDALFATFQHRAFRGEL